MRAAHDGAMYTNESTDAAEQPSVVEAAATEGVTTPDPYGGVALGVECAWPVLRTDRA